MVLVEGPTEALALPVYFERLGLNTTRDGIAVIPAGGVGNIAKWWRLFTAYEIPCYVIFDNDAKDRKKVEARQELLRTLKVADSVAAQLAVTDQLTCGGRATFAHPLADVLRVSDILK